MDYFAKLADHQEVLSTTFGISPERLFRYFESIPPENRASWRTPQAVAWHFLNYFNIPANQQNLVVMHSILKG